MDRVARLSEQKGHPEGPTAARSGSEVASAPTSAANNSSELGAIGPKRSRALRLVILSVLIRILWQVAAKYELYNTILLPPPDRVAILI